MLFAFFSWEAFSILEVFLTSVYNLDLTYFPMLKAYGELIFMNEILALYGFDSYEFAVFLGFQHILQMVPIELLA